MNQKCGHLIFSLWLSLLWLLVFLCSFLSSLSSDIQFNNKIFIWSNYDTYITLLLYRIILINPTIELLIIKKGTFSFCYIKFLLKNFLLQYFRIYLQLLLQKFLQSGLFQLTGYICLNEFLDLCGLSLARHQRFL